jgi:hypothetical protein
MRGVGHLFMDKSIEGIAGALINPFMIQSFVVPGGDAASLQVKGEMEGIVFDYGLFTKFGTQFPFD